VKLSRGETQIPNHNRNQNPKRFRLGLLGFGIWIFLGFGIWDLGFDALMPFFPVLLLVLGLGDVLIALHFTCACAGLVETELSGVLGADRDVREQAVQLLSLTFRAVRSIAGANQLLELVPAASALVFVDGHGAILHAR
jgi:hypothetical protein